MPPPILPTLADLARSPEAKIVSAYAAVVRADPLVSSVFRPIWVIENADRAGLLTWGERTLIVQPWQLRKEDFPSSREKLLVGIGVSAFLASEQTAENSALVGLDLGNHLRKIAFLNQALPNPSNPSVAMTFATVDFSTLTPLVTPAGVRILTYRTVYETDIDPKTGEFV